MKLKYGLLVGVLLSSKILCAADSVSYIIDLKGGEELCLEYPLRKDQVLSKERRKDIALLRLQQNSQAHIPKLQPNALKGFDYLLVLTLSGCTLGSIPKKALCSMRHLKKINMSNCGIKQELHSELFGKLYCLRHLDLSHNQIYGMRPGTFDGTYGRLPVLYTINLANNQLPKLEKASWDRVVRLIALDLRNNPIESIELGCLRGGGNLQAEDILLDSWEDEDLPDALNADDHEYQFGVANVAEEQSTVEDRIKAWVGELPEPESLEHFLKRKSRPTKKMTPQEFCLLDKPEKSHLDPLPWHITRRNYKH